MVWLPTPQAVVDKMLEIARVGPQDFVIDHGSGDGRTVITAARLGARAMASNTTRSGCREQAPRPHRRTTQPPRSAAARGPALWDAAAAEQQSTIRSGIHQIRAHRRSTSISASPGSWEESRA